MELQRPGATPTLPQWDLGIVLEAPLREPSFNHFTPETVFLLTMFSEGRSGLHALRFDQNCIQFKPNGAGVTPYFSPEVRVSFMLCFFGELSGLLPPQKRGGSRGPQGDSRLKVILSVGVTLCLPPWSQN